MGPKIRNIAIFIIISIVILLPYYIFRSEYIEKQYYNGITGKSEAIRPAAEMLNSEENPNPEKIKKIFNEIMANQPSAAALVLLDRSETLKYLIKNDRIIRSGAVVDQLMNDIKEKKFTSVSGSDPVVRNYRDGNGNSTFYICPYASGGQKAFAVFAFRLEKRLLIRLALEVILLLCFSVMLTGIILALLRKKGLTEDVNVRTIVLGAKKSSSSKEPGASSDSGDIRAVQIDENDLSPIVEPGTNRNRNEMIRRSNAGTEGAVEALNSRIFDLFKEIHKELKPESISLYIKKMEGRLSKTYELKEKTFLRIDSTLFDNIKISEIENVKRSGAHIIDNGKVIRIPLIDDESLLGLIEIRLKDSSMTLNLGRLENKVDEISGDIREFLVINNVIVDRETGFFSASYFSMKLSEQIYSAQKINTGFYLLLTDVFNSVYIDRDQKNTVLKIIYPVIKKSTGETRELFLYNGKIGMILPGANRREAEGLELDISRDISRFRIKLAENNTIRLKPVSVILNSAETENVKEILKEAMALFKSGERG